MQLLVLGKLGDVCKKLVELEILSEEQPKNNLLKVDIEAHKRVASSWPKPNVSEDEFLLQVSILKIEMLKLKGAEEELRATMGDDNVRFLLVNEYMNHLTFSRHHVAQLNKWGSTGIVDFGAGQATTEQKVVP